MAHAPPPAFSTLPHHMLHLLTTILSFYVMARLVLPLRLHLWLKLALCLLILICALKFYLFRLSFGTMMPELPRWALITTSVAHGALVLLIVLCALRDALLLSLWLVRKLWPQLPFLPLSNGQSAAGLLALALLLSAAAVWQALRVPDVRRLSLSLPRLPQALDGLRLVQLSDLHLSPAFPRPWVEQVVQKVNALQPDLIVITGDLADGPPVRLRDDLAPLARLRAPLGVFSCTGNHEYYWGLQGWMRQSRSLGITPLENAHVTLTWHGAKLTLAGVTDTAALSFGLPGPDIERALRGAAGESARILLAHQPHLIQESAAQGVDLQLSGHTHGGQLWGLNRIVARFNDGFLRGLYKVGESLIYVSPGTGLWAGFPLRLFVPSEITEILLRSGLAAAEK